MRHALLLLPLLLVGCHRSRAEVDQPPAAVTDKTPLPTIACTIAGAAGRCTVERDDRTLTIRHPDGGFRRLRITADGRGVEAADGAEPAHVAVDGGEAIAVAIGGDRYRLPATVSG